jgi:hypothetical protein
MTYIQYGCGLSAPSDWINFDASPTLRIQKFPIFGRIVKSRLNTIFPDQVLYGDIIKGLPGTYDNYCDGVYCSHILEHLSLDDFRIALRNTYKILKKGGIFRCVLPDLEYAAKRYIEGLESNKSSSNIEFLECTSLGEFSRQRGIKALIINFFGNSKHLFMWDRLSLQKELIDAGFSKVRPCVYNDSTDQMFLLVEDKGRFENSLAVEAIK